MKIFVVILIFIIAFVLNAAWEFWHAQFYIHYQGDAITTLVLLRAAITDAVIITVTIFIAIIVQSYFLYTKIDPDASGSIFAIPAWLIVAVLLEKWALSTNRWAYNDMMPIVPFVQTGLTPTIQLALLGTVSWYVARWLSAKAGKNRA